MLLFKFFWEHKNPVYWNNSLWHFVATRQCCLLRVKENCELLREARGEGCAFLCVFGRSVFFFSWIKGLRRTLSAPFQQEGAASIQILATTLWCKINSHSSRNSRISKVMVLGVRVREGSLLNLEIHLWRSITNLTLSHYSHRTCKGLHGMFLCHFHVEEWHAIGMWTSKPFMAVGPVAHRNCITCTGFEMM